MKIKALSAFSVMLFLIFTLLSACSSDSTGKEEEKEKDEEAKANFNEEGFPIVNDQIKLTFVAPSSDSPDWNDILDLQHI